MASKLWPALSAGALAHAATSVSGGEEVDDGGWCKQWQKLDLPKMPQADVADECWQACRDNADCEQAIFESAGPWGTQCWLGGNDMSERPASSRSCDGCVDHCYAKKGFGPTPSPTPTPPSPTPPSPEPPEDEPWPAAPLPPIGEQTDPYPAGKPPAPPFTDYAAMLDQEIQRHDHEYNADVIHKHGFMAGNLAYYIGGQFLVWDPTNNAHSETIGLTHPFFHDLRSRGDGMAQDKDTGYGHDLSGWAMWQDTKVAYGTVIIGEERFENPAPDSLHWRPDGMSASYKVGSATIREEKFISGTDVVVTTISSDKPVLLEFAGQSWWSKRRSISSKPTCTFDKKNNAVKVVEDGMVNVQPVKGQTVPGVMSYNGMTMVLSGSVPLENFTSSKDDKQCSYTFQMPLAAGGAVSLAWVMHDEEAEALRAKDLVLADVSGQRGAKTGQVNEFLNHQIPYFRCPDADVVHVYYYLWSLYYMYMIDVGKGFEVYPHTQTAVNNFLGLHRYDDMIHSRVGAWTANHTAYANGNILLWKALLPMSDLEQGKIPGDNMGQAWYSGPVGYKGLANHVANAWLIYEHSGDKAFLKETYDFYRKLMWNNIDSVWGFDLECPDYLGRMAMALNMPDDVQHWLELKGLDKTTIREWIDKRYDADRAWMKIGDQKTWASGFPYMHMDNFPDEYAEAMVERHAMDSVNGFYGKIALLSTRLDSWPDCASATANCNFMVTPDTNYLMLSGMFKHHVVAHAINATLNHLKHYHMRWGAPAAPETYNEKYHPHGDQYSNFNSGKIVVYLEGLLGLSVDVVKGSFVVADNCPREWAFMETRVPVQVDGKTEWTMVRVDRSEKAGQITKTVKVVGNKLKTLGIRPWTEGKMVVQEPDGATDGPRNHRGVTLTDTSDHSVTFVLADQRLLV